MIFRLKQDGGSVLEIDFDIQSGRLVSLGVRGDAEKTFDFAEWEEACRLMADRALLAGEPMSAEEISDAACLALSMALDGWWDEEQEEQEEPEEERLSVYVAVSRLIWRMAQGQEVTTREAARLMTRTRFQTFRFLKCVEAGGYLPLYYEKDTKKWRLLATRYLRI